MAHIETERLILRTWMPNDAAALLAVSQNLDNRYLPPKPTPTHENVSGSIDRMIAEQELEGFSIWPVIRKDTGALIGRCGLHRTEHGEVEVAWVIASDQCGQGFATEAARAAIDFGLRVMKIRQLIALVAPLNGASVKIANRCGMRFDRVVRAHNRDLLRYTISA